eukprot:404189-Heterocapsa_arctica.AAC.1
MAARRVAWDCQGEIASMAARRILASASWQLEAPRRRRPLPLRLLRPVELLPSLRPLPQPLRRLE